MKIILIDNDKEYTQKIERYFNKNNYNIITFNELEDLKKIELDINDLLIVNKKINIEDAKVKNILYLSENRKDDEKEKYIYKYQNIENILYKIFNIKMPEKNRENNEYNEKQKCCNYQKTSCDNNLKIDNAKIVVLYSLDNIYDYTNTIFKYIKNSMIKTLYLDNKSIPNIEKYHKFNNKYPNVINVFYTDSFDKYLININNKNLYTFYPSKNANEMLNIPLSKKIQTLKQLKENNFKLIVINMDNKYDNELIEFLKMTDKLLIFYNEKSESDRKILINSLDNIEYLKNVILKRCEINTNQNEKNIYEEIEKNLIGE